MTEPVRPLSPLSGSLAEIAAESLKLLIPVEPPAGGIIPHGGYCAVTHAKICQMKFIGLSDAATAKALKISLGTLRAWKNRYPKLRCDMEAACELSNAHAAVLLRKMMEGDGPTAFQAVKFYLSTHSPEFKECQDVNVHVDVSQTMRHIRTGLYGLPDPEGVPPGTPEETTPTGAELDADEQPPALPAPEAAPPALEAAAAAEEPKASEAPPVQQPPPSPPQAPPTSWDDL